jgi:catechol 2,3-dioxygenase-like lactoylglutathione lyase family enzyme
VITSLAHTAICVPDVDEALAWYESVLGLRVLAPPYRMEGKAIERDMGGLVPSPVVVKGAIVGTDDGDRVLEVMEYPEAPGRQPRTEMIEHGLSHIGLICDDVAATRAQLEAKGVTFLTSGVADVARLRTAWFQDPWGVVFILVEKSRPERAYWRQYG